ncbi:unnamed protein product, partial [Mesorhabditis belari]|uniref:C-type lectin domain-containing protein n=1 Tax=Mesorhabditis belari TaxID=2138241 RepID=A0AAF3FMR6_9BILA
MSPLCTQFFQFTDSITIPGYKLYDSAAQGIPYCVTATADGVNFFYLSSFCDKEDCGQYPLLIINDEQDDWQNCFSWQTKLWSCYKLVEEYSFTILWDINDPIGREFAVNSSLMIVSSEAPYDIHFVNTPEPPYEFVIDSFSGHQRLVTLTLESDLYVLKKFSQENPQSQCEYQMLSGNVFSPLNQLLIIKFETEPFIEQILENNIYTFVLPNNDCAPSVLIEKISIGDDAGIWATCPSNAVTGSDGSCFFVVPYNETFDNAEKFCENYFQGHTGSISNAFDNDLIQMMAEAFTMNVGYVWLGGTYDSGRVYWNDGSPDVYQNFRPAVPAGNILMNLSTGKMGHLNFESHLAVYLHAESE